MQSILKHIVIGLGAAVGLLGIGLATLVITSNSVVDGSEPVAFLADTVVDPTRNRELAYYAWYPTHSEEEAALFEENIVFRGFSAIENGSLKAGSYPLIVLSHGSGGNRANQSWLAVELARQGAIVVAVNHPGSMSMDSAPETNIQTWHRPADLSLVIDAMIEHAYLGEAIDANRIAVVGHSLGGYTALAVGGAQLELDLFINYCNENPSNADCSFYRGGNVDLTQVDRTQFEGAHKDDRVRAVVSIDPAFTKSFDAKSLDQLSPSLLIEAGSQHERMGDLNVRALGHQLTLRGHQVWIQPEAYHFTYLQDCKPIGRYLLALMEKDAGLLCYPESEADRATLHEETADQIINFLTGVGIL